MCRREGRSKPAPPPLPLKPNNLPPSKRISLFYIFFCGLHSHSLNIWQWVIYPRSAAGGLGVVYTRIGTRI